MFRCASCGALNQVPAGRAGTPVCGRCKQPLDTSGAPQEVDFAGLQRVVASARVPVLVDCWAPWCGPCRAVGPLVDQLARERSGRVLTLKLNTDENPQAGAQYGFRGIPTFLLFREGRLVGQRSGAMPKAMLQAFVDGAGEAAARP